jgi:hypothetical protein
VLTVICPSRGRPEAAAEVVETFKATVADLDTVLWFVVDPDDPTGSSYPSSDDDPVVRTHVLSEKPPQSGMLPALTMALEVPRILTDDTEVVGFIGDDHRFRTDAWDYKIETILELNRGIAYADDLFQRERLPTQWFVSRAIVDVFGMGPGVLRHLYIDDYWKTMGIGAGCLFYLPDIVIEHMHPLAGKGQWDDGYRRVNASEMYLADERAFVAWRDTQMPADVERLKGLLA